MGSQFLWVRNQGLGAACHQVGFHLKAQLGTDQLASSVTQVVGRTRFLVGCGTEPPSVPCHRSLCVGHSPLGLGLGLQKARVLCWAKSSPAGSMTRLWAQVWPCEESEAPCLSGSCSKCSSGRRGPGWWQCMWQGQESAVHQPGYCLHSS